MIQSFADEETQAVYLTGMSRQWAEIARVAARRLLAVDFASTVEDLRRQPGIRLEKLKDGQQEWWSICLSSQHRVSFRWDGANAWDVEIVDHF